MNQEQIVQLLQAFAEKNQIPFEELIQDFQSESPENQQKFLQEISQEMESSYSQVGGSIPINPNGYWDLDPLENPEVMIPSGDISMAGIDYEIDAYDARTGKHLKRMQPGQQYKFPTDMVVERPVYAQGGVQFDINKAIQEADAKIIELKKQRDIQLANAESSRKSVKESLLLEKYQEEIKNLEQKQQELNTFYNTWISNNKPNPEYFKKYVNRYISSVKQSEKTIAELDPRNYTLAYGSGLTDGGSASNSYSTAPILVRNNKNYTSNPIEVIQEVSTTSKQSLKAQGKNKTYNLNLESFDGNKPFYKDEDGNTWSLNSNGDAYVVDKVKGSKLPSTPISKKNITTLNNSIPVVEKPKISFLPSLDEKDDVVERYKVPNATKPESTLWSGDIGAMSKVADIVDPSTGRYMYTDEVSPSTLEEPTLPTKRFLGRYDTTPPTGAFKEMMYQANQPISMPYRTTPDLRWSEIPLIDIDPILSNIEDQEYAALQNVDTSTATGRAYANQVMQNTQKAVIDTSNQVNQQNQQIKAQNEASRVNTINQMETNRVNADRQYVDEIQRSEATRDMLRLNAKSYQDQLLGMEKRERNNLTSIMMNLPQISSIENPDGSREMYLDTSYMPSVGTYNDSVMTTTDGRQVVKIRDKNGKIEYREVVTGNQDTKQTGGKKKKFKMQVW